MSARIIAVAVAVALGACGGDVVIPGATGGGGASSAFEGCAGKACGDSCTPCDTSDPECQPGAALHRCLPSGECSKNEPTCPE